MADFLNFKGEQPLYNAGMEAVQDYTRGGGVRTKVPRYKLKVAPFLPPFTPLELVSSDFGGLIINAQFQKSRGMSHGTLTMTIAADDKRGLEGLLPGPLKGLWENVGASLRDVFKPMTYVQFLHNGYHVMSGIVRSFRKSTKVGKRFGQRIYSIEMDELGVVYNQNIMKKSNILFGEHLHIIDDVNKVLNLSGNIVGAPLSTALMGYANAFIGSSLAFGSDAFPSPYFTMSDGLPLAMRLIALGSPLGGISNTSLISTIVADSSFLTDSSGGSFWGFLQNLCPSPWMELFTESGGRTICVGKTFGGAITGIGNIIPGLNTSVLLPGFNYIIARTSPYSNIMLGFSLWQSALYLFITSVFDLLLSGDFIIITDDMVVEKDLGQSDAAQYTVFNTRYGGKSAANAGVTDMNKPVVAGGPLLPFFPGGVRTYGNREFERSINPTSLNWLGLVGETTERIIKGTASLSNIHAMNGLLCEWFRNVSKFMEGTITVKPAIPYARPGMLLLYLPTYSDKFIDDPREIGMYYIDNISTGGAVGTADSTQFTVIRGTPMPMTLSSAIHMLLDWDLRPIRLNLSEAPGT